MDVGFIGLGRMGRPMARNLLKAGHRVVVWDRTRRRAEELRDEGAEIADTPAGACKGEIVITMLANDDAVEEVVLGSGHVVSALRQNAIYLSMSTISVALSEELTEVHYAAAQHFVAAPVFGRPEAAAAAKLFVVVAGEPEPVDRCKVIAPDIEPEDRRIGGELMTGQARILHQQSAHGPSPVMVESRHLPLAK
jgi:3-hydroxyisobutyrate dehydrogenase-like beta-hydroxyacid dehydrogenase